MHVRRRLTVLGAAAATAALPTLHAAPVSAATGHLTIRMHRITNVAVPANATSTCNKAVRSDSFEAGTRFDWCANFQVTITQFVNEEPVGTAAVVILDYASWQVSSRAWTMSHGFYETASAGVLAGVPVTISGLNTCSSGCTVGRGASYADIVPEAPGNTIEKIQVSSPGTATDTGILTSVWTFSDGDFVADPPITMIANPVRCDSETGNRYPAGCVDPTHRARYELDSTAYPTVAAFDAAAIAAQPAWRSLTRITDGRKIDANRSAACKGFKKQGPQDSCDEFPYASTAEGGVNARRAHVPITENKAQGGNLGAFYVRNRVFDGETFSVAVT